MIWACSHVLRAAPKHLVFTYQGDPSSSVTANWQVTEKTAIDPGNATVYYDTVSRGGDVEAYAHSTTGSTYEMDGLAGRSIYRNQLNGLTPNTTYYLVVGNTQQGFSEEVKIRTLPNDDSPLRFATGGDMGTSEDTRTLLRHAASHDPYFAVIGGDIAYADGKLDKVDSWDTWLDYYTEVMITPDGFQIPIILAIGNHEVRGSYDQPKENAPFFFGFFAQDLDQTYFSFKFSDHFALIVLDSGHITTHESQVGWLREQLESFQDVTQVAAVYHVPLYPSHRGLWGNYSTAGRQHWGPLFDEFKLTVGFEN
jgi:hypothetical protein